MNVLKSKPTYFTNCLGFVDHHNKSNLYKNKLKGIFNVVVVVMGFNGSMGTIIVFPTWDQLKFMPQSHNHLIMLNKS
jgi:hypothetical protein